MKKQKVIDYWGSVAEVAEQMSLTPQAVYAWPELLPFEVACKVQVRTRNILLVDPKDYDL